MWFFFALAASYLQASARLVNQYRKLPGIQLTFASKILKTLLVIPLVFVIIWPEDPLFYIYVAITAPLAVYQDKSIFDFTARFGAGTVTRIEPLTVPVIFILWLILHPALLLTQLQTPLWLCGIILCIGFAVFCALRTRKHPISAGALKAMIPLLLCMSALSIFSKSVVDLAPGTNGVMAYLFMQSILMVVISGFFNPEFIRHPMTLLGNKSILKTALLISLLTMGVMILRLYGFIYAANPAYVTAVMLTSPFWVMLFYKIVAHKEEGDIKAGIGIVVSAIALTILVALSGH